LASVNCAPSGGTAEAPWGKTDRPYSPFARRPNVTAPVVRTRRRCGESCNVAGILDSGENDEKRAADFAGARSSSKELCAARPSAATPCGCSVSAMPSKRRSCRVRNGERDYFTAEIRREARVMRRPEFGEEYSFERQPDESASSRGGRLRRRRRLIRWADRRGVRHESLSQRFSRLEMTAFEARGDLPGEDICRG